MNGRPAHPGHVRVIPWSHLPRVFDLDPDTAAALGRATPCLAPDGRPLPERLAIERHGGRAGDRNVHVHLLPPRPSDGRFQVYPPDAVPPVRSREEFGALAAVLQTASG